MSTSRCSHLDTKPLPSNVIDFRDEAFYGFIRQFSGKRVFDSVNRTLVNEGTYLSIQAVYTSMRYEKAQR
jgi:hypothetical protein